MTGLELMTKFPYAAEEIRQWFLNEMIESFEDEEVPEEFKQMMRDTGISVEHVAKLIDINPRVLFDVFDKNKIYVEITREIGAFGATVYSSEPTNTISNFKDRKSAELSAIVFAFQALNLQLTPVIFETLDEKDNTES